MYLPKYTITNQILNAVSKVEAAKEIIENSPLIPLWERDFILDAKTRTVHYSTHLEGNPLKFPEVKRKYFWGSGLWAKSIYFYGVGRDKKQMEDYIAKQKFARKLISIDSNQKTLSAF